MIKYQVPIMRDGKLCYMMVPETLIMRIKEIQSSNPGLKDITIRKKDGQYIVSEPSFFKGIKIKLGKIWEWIK